MKVYTVADNITSPLGNSTADNITALEQNKSAIALSKDPALSPQPVHISKVTPSAYQQLKTGDEYTYLENLIIHSIKSALNHLANPLSLSKTVLVLSSTKGNVDLLAQKGASSFPYERIMLPTMAKIICQYFNIEHLPVIVSNACISGVSALLTAKKLITTQQYDHAIVCGADLISEFVISGFQSFLAISDQPCKPYDKSRNGITLGEAAGTIILSNNPTLATVEQSHSVLSGGGQSNDANHISGPSRNGEGLKIAIERALHESRMSIENIDYINAHGTATEYNDEMECQAFNRVNAQYIPLNSLKSYYGHTLGASGTIESIAAIWQMNNNMMVKSRGYETHGLTGSLEVLKQNTNKAIDRVMKTSSGFGGCNAAIIFEKHGTGN